MNCCHQHLSFLASGKFIYQSKITNFISLLGISGITAEQVIAVKSARKRLGGKITSLPSSNFDDSVSSSLSYKTDDKAVKLLKDLKERYEANEISEEEFKLQKQKILESI